MKEINPFLIKKEIIKEKKKGKFLEHQCASCMFGAEIRLCSWQTFYELYNSLVKKDKKLKNKNEFEQLISIRADKEDIDNCLAIKKTLSELCCFEKEKLNID